MTALKKQAKAKPFTKAELLDAFAKKISVYQTSWKKRKNIFRKDNNRWIWIEKYFADMERLAALAEKMSKEMGK